jgi:acid phosphatase (class A)
MKRFAGHVVVVCAVLAISGVSHAQFVKTDAVDFKTILSAPPAADSDQTKAELDQMVGIQKGHTPDDPDVARARREVNMTPFIYSEVLGSGFNPDDLPVTAKLMAEVTKTASPIVGRAKAYFGRKRPFLVDSRIEVLVAEENTPSYPSGHSTRATVWAMVLCEIFPEQKEALMARAHQIGDDRVLGGMHFPSDVEAGRKLAAEIVRQMLDNPDFKAQVEAARAETKNMRVESNRSN